MNSILSLLKTVKMRNKTELLEQALDVEVDYDYDREGAVINKVTVFIDGKHPMDITKLLTVAAHRALIARLEEAEYGKEEGDDFAGAEMDYE